jgi:formylmethanofuran dehydrogenase subunit E
MRESRKENSSMKSIFTLGLHVLSFLPAVACAAGNAGQVGKKASAVAERIGQLPQPDYQRQPSDPPWLANVVQFHGHLGPAVVAGARMGMIGLCAVEAKGYFDVEVTCEGPLAKPPQACFLDGVQVATGATMGKRSLHWVQADQVLVRVKNIRTGRIVDVRPTPALLDLLGAFKPQAKAGTGHGPESKADDEHLAAVARKIAAMPDKDVGSVRWWREGE